MRRANTKKQKTMKQTMKGKREKRRRRGTGGESE